MTYRRVLSGALAALGALLATVSTSSLAAAAPSSVRLPGSASPVAASTPRVGSVPAGSPVSFEVELALPHQAAAEAFARAVSTPGSALYRHFLTPAQWEQRFSPTAGQVAEVVGFLRHSGLHVTGVSADRMAVQATGSAAAVERAFGTRLSYHRVDGHALRVADRDLSLPAAIARVVAGIAGLNQVLAHPGAIGADPAVAPTTVNPPQPPGFRVAHPCSSYWAQLVASSLPPFGGGYPSPAPYTVCGYNPQQLRSAYGLTRGPDGTGTTVAIVDAYASPTLFSDAHHYSELNDPTHPLTSSQFSELLPSSFNQNDLCGASGWYGEQTLDVEAVHSTAPGAHILYVGGHNCGEGDLNAAVRAIVDGHLADVITNSYGDNGGDALDPAGMRAEVDHVLMMAAATGISVLFSSGDNGDEFSTLGAVVADYPASSPWATAVGGTSLEVGQSGQRLAEYGWSTARSYLCNQTLVTLGGCTDTQLGTWSPLGYLYGSGGGTSLVYPQPAYQDGVVPYALSHFNSAIVGPQAMRVVPDISMDADPSTGMLVGETQTFPNGVYYDQYRIGGTSLASPLLAGVIARADQAAGHALGFVNPAMYSLYGNSAALYDILPAGRQGAVRADFANSLGEGDGKLFSFRAFGYEGTEQFCNANGNDCRSRDVALQAAPGYDNMTGLGSVGDAFVSALSGK
ncbi:MAG TPA: S53 family peptidase [Solirubrobacteraceae bacterium]|nr:S53 family peptidase [Solirubrobacteraceae bacterium]